MTTPAQVWSVPSLPMKGARAVRVGKGTNEPVIGRRGDGQPERLPLELAACLNVWAYRCRRALMANISSAPLIGRNKKTGELIDTNKGDALAVAARDLLALIENPNSEQSGNDLVESIVDWMNVRQAFIWMVPTNDSPTDDKKRPILLKMLPAERVAPVRDKFGLLTAWEVKGGAAPLIIPEWQVIRIGFHNPKDPLRGLPPMSVAFMSADLGYAIQLHHIGYFDRGAKLSGVLAPKGDVGEGLQLRMQAAADSVTGVSNSHQLLVLPTEAEFTSFEDRVKDGDFQALSSIIRDEMAGAHGVPRFMLGVPDDANRANSRDARRSFLQDTCIPQQKDIRDKLNRKLAWRFHPDLLLDFDLSKVDALGEDRREFAGAMNQIASSFGVLVRQKIMTEKEARDVLRGKFGLNLDEANDNPQESEPQEPQPTAEEEPEEEAMVS